MDVVSRLMTVSCPNHRTTNFPSRRERFTTISRELSAISRVILFLTIGAVFTSSIMAADAAFPATAPGTTEIKTLPPGVLLKSASPEGTYFENGGSLFRPLFRYISSHDISMTVPVEASIDDAAMYFWVAKDQEDRVSQSKAGVEVIKVPARRVVSHGYRGSYSAKNYASARTALMAWIDTQPNLAVSGEPYAVYWNGPFTPGFLKRFEVHVRVASEIE